MKNGIKNCPMDKAVVSFRVLLPTMQAEKIVEYFVAGKIQNSSLIPAYLNRRLYTIQCVVVS